MNGISRTFALLAAAMLILAGCSALSQVKEKPKPDKRLTAAEYYVLAHRNLAIREMVRTGIPASIKIAQGMLESGCGNSKLSRVAKNHFGIKCVKDWPGQKVYFDDDEAKECFRVYDSVEASFRDHSDFLKGNPRYQELFELDISDYRGWARGLKEAGYATRPDYDQLLVRIIEKHRLHVYDKPPDGSVGDWYEGVWKWIGSSSDKSP